MKRLEPGSRTVVLPGVLYRNAPHRHFPHVGAVTKGNDQRSTFFFYVDAVINHMGTFFFTVGAVIKSIDRSVCLSVSYAHTVYVGYTHTHARTRALARALARARAHTHTHTHTHTQYRHVHARIHTCTHMYTHVHTHTHTHTHRTYTRHAHSRALFLLEEGTGSVAGLFACKPVFLLPKFHTRNLLSQKPIK